MWCKDKHHFNQTSINFLNVIIEIQSEKENKSQCRCLLILLKLVIFLQRFITRHAKIFIFFMIFTNADFSEIHNQK